MPFRQTAAAAAGGSVLRDEHRMSPHGGLLAVVFRFGRCKPLGDEICRVVGDRIPPLLADVLLVLRL